MLFRIFYLFSLLLSLSLNSDAYATWNCFDFFKATIPKSATAASNAILISNSLWFGARIQQGDYRLVGKGIPVVGDFDDPDQSVRHVYKLRLETATGLQYSVLSRQNISHDTELSKYPYTSMPWRMALMYPQWMNAYGIRADHTHLIMPSFPTLNTILDSLAETPYAVGPRFEALPLEMKGDDQRYSSAFFFPYFVRGVIPLASYGELAFHDIHEEHLIGALLMPPRHFLRLVNFARRVGRLESIPLIQKHFASQLATARLSFSPLWDHLTGGMGFYFPNKLWNYDERWERGMKIRNRILQLVGGRPMELMPPLEGVNDRETLLSQKLLEIDVVRNIREAMVTMNASDKKQNIRTILKDAEFSLPTPEVDSADFDEVFLSRLGQREPDVQSLSRLNAGQR